MRLLGTPLAIALCTLLAVVFLFVDLIVPLGVAVGVSYILVVVLSAWPRVIWLPAAFATLSTLLIGVGWLGAPWVATSDPTFVAANRLLTVLVLWVIAATLVFRIRAERRSEQILRESEARFRTFFENCAIPLWEEDWSGVRTQLEALTASGVGDVRSYLFAHPEVTHSCMSRVKLLDTNQASLDLFRAPDKEALLVNLEHLIAPESWNVVIDQLGEIADGNSHFRGDQFVVTFTGEKRFILFDFAALPGSEATLERVLVSLVDATDAKKALETLRAADQRKDEFIATLGHELRNPLAAIRNAVELLKLESSKPENLVLARDIIDRQTESLTRLIDDLLEISRVTQGKIQLQTQPVNLGALAASAAQECRPLAEDSQHQLDIDVPERGPWVLGDPTRLNQVMTNLFTNAIKYTPDGGQVRLTVESDDEYAVASVRDTGIGISSDRLESVFDMFSQVRPALERSNDGLGIGLALVKGLVELHGGQVEARSDGEGQGSEFIVRLPLADKPTESVSASAQSNEGIEGVRRCKVLVVDDNPDVARSLGTMLRATGHEIRTAHDGEEAFELARSFRPEVVLLDIGLPKANGYDVARHIRAEDWGREMVLIAQTGWGKEDDKRRAKAAGFDHHLTKPVQKAALMRIIENP